VTVTRRCGSSRHEDAIGHACVQVHVVVERGAEAVQEGDAATDGHTVGGHAARGDATGFVFRPRATRRLGRARSGPLSTGQSFRRRIDELPDIDIHSL
jgi:hypothetical protein